MCGALKGDKQQRQALVGQSRALLIVSVLIESHNEMSGAGIIVGRSPAATGFPLHGDASFCLFPTFVLFW